MFRGTDKRDRLVNALHGLADELDIAFREGSADLARFSEWIGEVTGTGQEGALAVRVALLCVDDGDTPDIGGPWNSRTARRAALDVIAPVWFAHDVPAPRTWSGPGEAYAVAPAESPDRLSHRMPRRIETFDLVDGLVRVQLRTWLAATPWETTCRTPDEVRAFVRSVLADIGDRP